MKVHTYLNYGGNCEEAFRFYEEHLGAKIMMLMKHGQEPGGAQHSEMSGVLHARLQLGDTFISGADVSAERWKPMRSAYMRSRSTATRRLSGSMRRWSKAERSSCPCRKRFSPSASACCGTGSERRG